MSTETLTAAHCRTLLTSKQVGRVVFTDGALPSALPVNFLVDADEIVFRVDPDGRVAAAVAGPDGAVLAFEVDSIDEKSDAGWSVLVVGLARRVDEPARVRWLERLQMPAWGVEGTGVFIRIPLSRVTGRAVGRLPDIGSVGQSPLVVAAGRPLA